MLTIKPRYENKSLKPVKDNFRWNLFNQQKQCKTAGIDEMYFEAHANLNYDIRATAGLTLIVSPTWNIHMSETSNKLVGNTWEPGIF